MIKIQFDSFLLNKINIYLIEYMCIIILSFTLKFQINLIDKFLIIKFKIK